MQVTRTIYYPGYIREGKRYNLPTTDFYFEAEKCFQSDDFKKAAAKGDPFVFKKDAVFIREEKYIETVIGGAYEFTGEYKYIFEKFVDEKPSEYANNVIEIPITEESFFMGAEFGMPGTIMKFKYSDGSVLSSYDGIAWEINLMILRKNKTLYGFSYKLLGTEVEFELKFPL